MGTKSKKSKAFLVWLCFFLGINILIGLAALGWEHKYEIWDQSGDILPVILGDVKDTSIFKQDIGDRLNTF